MEDVLYLDLIAKRLSGNLLPQEERELSAWVEATPANRQFYDEMLQLWSLSAEYDTPYQPDTSKAWNRLSDRIEGNLATLAPPQAAIIPLRRTGFRTLITAAAAVVALALGVWLFAPSLFQPRWETIATTEGERREISMPDGSKVWLNQSSTLSYPKAFATRTVKLTGEAFFEVKKDPAHPFIISSGDIETRVLGTSFNIRAYPGEKNIKVSVVTGKVEVSVVSKKTNTPQAAHLFLLPGDAGVYSKNEQQLDTAATVVNPITWKAQQLIFKSTPLKQVIPILEDYFNTKINVTSPVLLDCTFTASFEYDSLDTVFLVLKEALVNIKIDKQQGEYFLSGSCSQ
jgi:ferric-dicitrate binding protein FerR (iron transport regulator)